MADTPRVQWLADDQNVASTLVTRPDPLTYEAVWQWILDWQKRGFAWAICKNFDQALIGVITLEIVPRHESAEVRYWLGHRYWGHGFATEAAREVVHYAFAVLRLHRITARCFSRNRASARVLEKIGMKHEGHLRQHVKHWMGFEDVDVYGILREEYIEEA